MLRRLALLWGLLLLAGCALFQPVQPPPPADPEAMRCLNLYEAMDRAVAEFGVSPSYPVRIEGFPYLRVNRFLAGYGDEYLDAAGLSAWLGRLAERDVEARAVELASLPQPVLDTLTRDHATPDELSETLAGCAVQLREQDLASPERLALLQDRAEVPSEYRTHWQVLGIYPLTALPVNFGVYLWHQRAQQVFDQPVEVLPVEGELRRFRPPENPLEPPSLAGVPRDSLGIPLPGPAQLDALFAAHAPVWEIDVVGDFDLPGSPFWQEDGVPSVDPAVPVTYRYVSHTRWQGEPLLQLNYLIWFAERPIIDPIDILLGGALDGLIWRVTLDGEGNPLLYDSIHPCGCYHKFFPARALQLRPEAERLPEPPLVPQRAPVPEPGERIVVRAESGTHYIQGVHTDVPTGEPYAWRDYRALYAVPVAGTGRRSLFGPDGLVAGTERLERWLFWPMGIPSPGAQRERGRHATAFVGRRHFDDHDLLEQLFKSGK